MASQIPKTLSKAQVLQLKPLRLPLKPFMVSLCVISACIWLVLTATCPPSVPSSAAKIADQSSFTGFTNIQTYGVARGQVSNSLFYLYRIASTNAAVRKVDAFDSQTWMASFVFDTIMKSLSVDAAEQTVYFARAGNPIMIMRMTASVGSILTQHQL